MKNQYYHDKIDERNIDWQENKNPLVRLFYKLKYKIAIKYANLRWDDLILDFGCGTNWLKKKMLPGYDVIGYDIDPKLTEIKDYTKLKPDKIFVIDVLEHVEKEEIRKIIKNFKKMNPNFILIAIIPTETWLWRKARKILGLSETVEDHITKLSEILQILNEELTQIKKINFLTMSYITKFESTVCSKWK